MTLGFYVATDHCYGCKTCTIACANEHLLSTGVFLRRVRHIDTSDPVGHAFVSMSCNHCDDPACVKNCPVGAYTKDEETGLVVQDHSLCIGCKSCIEACPFHAPAYCEEDSTTYKCDGCVQRRSIGLQPVCTIVCPSANISMDEFDTLLSSHSGCVSVKDKAETKPNLAVMLDKDITADVFTDIDYAEGLVDAGGEGY
jgi:anaerobic dimethyl sulfoxide reductase subunit B